MWHWISPESPEQSWTPIYYIYISRKLRPRKRRYATLEKECLAIVWAEQTLRVYLHDQNFTIQTDHHPLQWLDQKKNKNGRLTHWSLLLHSYKFTIHHRSGKENSNADTLSRLAWNIKNKTEVLSLEKKRGIYDDIFKWQVDILLIF